VWCVQGVSRVIDTLMTAVVDDAAVNTRDADDDSNVVMTSREVDIKEEVGDADASAEQLWLPPATVSADHNDAGQTSNTDDIDERLKLKNNVENDDDEDPAALDTDEPATETGDAMPEYLPASDAARDGVGHCRVCGDEATGMYFGALVCVPCKV